MSKSVSNFVGRAGGDVVTGGLAEFGKKDPFYGLVTNKSTGAVGFIPALGSGNPTNPSAPTVGGTVSPMQLLMDTGGAPLLSSIAMGSDPNTALASYFGVNPAKFNDWLAGLDPASQSAVLGLQSNLTNISNNTQAKTAAVQQLVNDFPNFMATEIPKYKGIADQATMDAANLALSKTVSKYAAGGNLSSGAAATAVARTGAEFEQNNLDYATNLANNEFMNKFNSANALLSFQQKMMGQTADKGMSAVDTMLNINAKQASDQASLTYGQNNKNQNTSNAMFGALGSLGGTLLAPTVTKAGSALASNFFNSPSSGTGYTGGGTSNGPMNGPLNLD